MDAPFSFNRSVRIGSRRDRITGDSGALAGRELLTRSGVVRFLGRGLPDQRDARRIRHSQRRLVRTLLLLAGQGRREHSDATALRDDPALRLATSDRAGTAPLAGGGRLPSEPTLSRRVAAWSAKEGVEVLREGLQRLAGGRLNAMGGGGGRGRWSLMSTVCRSRRASRSPAAASLFAIGGASAHWLILARGLATLHGHSG